MRVFFELQAQELYTNYAKKQVRRVQVARRSFGRFGTWFMIARLRYSKYYGPTRPDNASQASCNPVCYPEATSTSTMPCLNCISCSLTSPACV